MTTTTAGRPGTIAVSLALVAGLCWSAWLRLDRPVDLANPGSHQHHHALPDMRIDLNSAGAAQIGLLPGIGPRLAQRIVDHRDAHGSFASIDDLADVPGIGPRILDGARPYLIVSRVEPDDD
jgi:competence ComEA-like helix-hairpin-helix protein